jgi:hypothetical protein
MIKVKVTTAWPEIPLIRMTPDSKGIIGDFQFFVNQEVQDPDWWIVVDGLAREEQVICPPENTLLIVQETEVVKKYQQDYTDQFHWVITCQETLKHPRKIYTQQAHQSYLFMKRRGENQSLESYQDQFKTYDELRAMTPASFSKIKTLSAVISHKTRTSGAIARFNFVTKAKEHFGSTFDIYSNKPDVFGPETKVVGQKWDAVANYKYVLSIENSSVPHWWTNHLFDAFLVGAYPIYFGHQSVFDYFPKNSLTLIDVNDIPGSIKIMEKVISENYQEKYQKEIWEARKLVLDKYNLFQTIIDTIQKLPQGQNKKKIIFRRERDKAMARKQKLIRIIKKIPLIRPISQSLYRKYRFMRYGEKRQPQQ